MNSPEVTSLGSPALSGRSPRFGGSEFPSRAPESFTVMIRGHISSAQIVGPDAAVCSYEIVTGPDWLMQHGSSNGETQLAQNKAFKPDLPSSVWNFPIEIAYKSTNVFGWPRIVLSVRDRYRTIVGYTSIHVPTQLGLHTRYCKLFTPRSGSELQATIASMTGETPEFFDPRFVTANDGREAVRVTSSGVVKIEFSVACQGLARHGFVLGEKSFEDEEEDPADEEEECY